MKRPSSRQPATRGFIRPSTAIMMVFLAALGYVGWVGVQYWTTVYRLRVAALETANRAVSVTWSQGNHVQVLIDKIEAFTGTTLRRSEMTIERDQAGHEATIGFTVDVPIVWPFTSRIDYREVTIEVSTTRARGY